MKCRLLKLPSFCILLLWSVMFAQVIPFEHQIIDAQGIGHRQVADIDGDGMNDIAAVKHSNDKDRLIWYHYPDWREHLICQISEFKDFPCYRSCDMRLADMDNDGDPDLVGRIGRMKDIVHGVNCWFENPGSKAAPNTTWRRHDIVASHYAKDLVVTDFNLDGKKDVVFRAEDAKLVIALQTSADHWLSRSLEVPRLDGTDVGDIDRDGDPDIVINGMWLETPNDPIKDEWIKRDFDDKWYVQRTGSKGAWYDNNSKVVLRDMDQDGLLDIIIVNSENRGYPVSWYKAPVDPKTGVWKEHIIGYMDKSHNLNVADFDNDGDWDVMAGEMPNKPEEAPYPIVVFINQGGALRWSEQKLADWGNYSDSIGDIDNDGDIDIIGLRNYNRAPIEIWRNKTSDNKLSLDHFTYLRIDSVRTRMEGKKQGGGGWFGLDMGDGTGDGYQDIVAGKWFYRNPKGNLSLPWPRITLGDSLDAVLMVNVDDDKFGDVIALKCNQQFWLEAKDSLASAWAMHRIGSLPICNHGTGSQGYAVAQIIPGGKKEILLNDDSGIFYLQIPAKPDSEPWPSFIISKGISNGEMVTAADVDNDGDLDVASGYKIGEQENGLAWWENPGRPIAAWTMHPLGQTRFAVDRLALADMNGDRKMDLVVTEERYPGPDPDASLYWFEQPADVKSERWLQHKVVTEYSLNNLSVADADRDGDQDIITCEHKGPKEKLQIWENDGNGHFNEHLIDQGKESHLGSRVADLDMDGDLDIVSIVWEDFQYLHLWRNDAMKQHILQHTANSKIQSQAGGHYRLRIQVRTGAYDRLDTPVEIKIDQRTYGQFFASGNSNLALVEIAESGGVINGQVPFQFEKNNDPSTPSQNAGTLVFLLTGETSANCTRYYQLCAGPAEKKAKIEQKVQVQEGGLYEQYDSYKITTPAAVYYFHKKGSGFASMIDREGKDWISYHPSGGSAGNYRGIPNMGVPDFHPGPGDANQNSVILHSGPVRTTLLAQTLDGQTACTWDFYSDHATMTVLKKGPEPYWILYEGTPFGKLDLADDYWGMSNGEQLSVADPWVGELPGPEWVYFGDKKCNRVLYLIQHQDDEALDQFWPMEKNMTVFGFGRQYRCCERYMSAVPAKLSIGFAETGQFPAIRRIIDSILRPVEVQILDIY